MNKKENNVKPKTYKSDKLSGKPAFTIIELLTVMSIIIILIGLLVPSLNMAKRYAKEVRQKAQFHSIDSALELFNGEHDGYPPSAAKDGAATPASYCGAQKLCEALVGQDLMGFHPLSRFRADCTVDGTATMKLYDNNPSGQTLYPDNATNLKARKTYLQQTSDAYKLSQLYGTSPTPSTSLTVDLYVLCDVYNRVKHKETGKGVGMPILYYRANTANILHDPNRTNVPVIGDDKGYIYNYTDNDELVKLNVPGGVLGTQQPLSSTYSGAVTGTNFYDITRDMRIPLQTIGTTTSGRPYRPDSYILISAGYDGTYGTDDDIFNFEK
jgi:type II secretory pathway pseudopilin PulG